MPCGSLPSLRLLPSAPTYRPERTVLPSGTMSPPNELDPSKLHVSSFSWSCIVAVHEMVDRWPDFFLGQTRCVLPDPSSIRVRSRTGPPAFRGASTLAPDSVRFDVPPDSPRAERTVRIDIPLLPEHAASRSRKPGLRTARKVGSKRQLPTVAQPPTHDDRALADDSVPSRVSTIPGRSGTRIFRRVARTRRYQSSPVRMRLRQKVIPMELR